MAKFWKSKEFLEEKAKWDQKLKDSGFVDAEKELSGKSVLIAFSSDEGCWKNKGLARREEREEYYTALYQCFIKETDFADESDRLIMERTAEGKSKREISDELKEKKQKKHNRDTITYIRRRYENKWGIRKWLPYQMVSRRVTR